MGATTTTRGNRAARHQSVGIPRLCSRQVVSGSPGEPVGDDRVSDGDSARRVGLVADDRHGAREALDLIESRVDQRPSCPKCRDTEVVRNGQAGGLPRYKCRGWGGDLQRPDGRAAGALASARQVVAAGPGAWAGPERAQGCAPHRRAPIDVVSLAASLPGVAPRGRGAGAERGGRHRRDIRAAPLQWAARSGGVCGSAARRRPDCSADVQPAAAACGVCIRRRARLRQL
jgi:hypothetical protein